MPVRPQPPIIPYLRPHDPLVGSSAPERAQTARARCYSLGAPSRCSASVHIQEVKPMGFFTRRATLLSMFVPVAVALAGCSQPASTPVPATAAPAAPAQSPVERGKML